MNGDLDKVSKDIRKECIDVIPEYINDSNDVEVKKCIVEIKMQVKNLESRLETIESSLNKHVFFGEAYRLKHYEDDTKESSKMEEEYKKPLTNKKTKKKKYNDSESVEEKPPVAKIQLPACNIKQEPVSTQESTKENSHSDDVINQKLLANKKSKKRNAIDKGLAKESSVDGNTQHSKHIGEQETRPAQEDIKATALDNDLTYKKLTEVKKTKKKNAVEILSINSNYIDSKSHPLKRDVKQEQGEIPDKIAYKDDDKSIITKKTKKKCTEGNDPIKGNEIEAKLQPLLPDVKQDKKTSEHANSTKNIAVTPNSIQPTQVLNEPPMKKKVPKHFEDLKSDVKKYIVSNANQKPESGGFKRVKVSEVNPNKIISNAYEHKAAANRSDYGMKAYNDLIKTRGRDFRAEKNKKKKGRYSGGKINTEVCSVKLDASDDEF